MNLIKGVDVFYSVSTDFNISFILIGKCHVVNSVTFVNRLLNMMERERRS